MAAETGASSEEPRGEQRARISYLRWLVLFALLLILGYVAIERLRTSDHPPAKKRQFQSESELRWRSSEAPVAIFTDVTAPAGVRFRHHTGARGDLWMPENMGAGCAFLDFDNDGRQDLFFVNSSPWPSDDVPGDSRTTSALYRGLGDGMFADVTEGSGLDVVQYGMGVAVGDYDGDNRVDVFVTNLGPNRLFKNLGGGKFLDVTDASGVAGRAEDWSTSCAFFDFDKDGDLDLFVCNYGKWSPKLESQFPFSGRAMAGKAGLRTYLSPPNLPTVDCYLYQNAGDGTFRDVAAAAGIQIRSETTDASTSQALGVRPFDFDGDRWLDLIVTNDLRPQFLFLNQRDGTFREIGTIAGIAFDDVGEQIAGMGVDVGLVGPKDSQAIVIDNFARRGDCVFVARPDGDSFAEASNALGIKTPTLPVTGFGLFFLDYDLDGRLDLFQTNGHVFTEEVADYFQEAFRQPSQLFWKKPPGETPEFVLVSPEHAGQALGKEILGRGAAYGDIDGDGDLDMVITENGGPAIVLRNDQRLGHHWLRLRLQGKPPNTSAIGAEARLRVDGKTMSRMVMPSRSYLSQVELPLTFGLGKATAVEFLEIVWPDGSRQRVERPVVNQLLTIVQGE